MLRFFLFASCPRITSIRYVLLRDDINVVWRARIKGFLACCINIRFRTIMFFIIVFVSVVLSIFICVRFSRKSRIVFTLEKIQQLLNPSPGMFKECALRSRANPNVRLIRILGITNTFVSDDPEVHRQFIAKTTSFLPRSYRDWLCLQHTARSTVERALLDAQDKASVADGSPIDFAKFHRIITFYIISIALLGADAAAIDYDDVQFVTDAISELWALSKTDAMPPPGLLNQVNNHLNKWFPHVGHDDHLLDYIIPTYETMWRVVAIAVARAADIDDRATFRSFLDHPTNDQFCNFPGDRPSVEAYVNEILRVHPPTKHIARAIPPSFPHLLQSFIESIPTGLSEWLCNSLTHTVTADINTLHKNPSIWCDDALDFDPMRFHPTRFDYKAKDVAPKMAAIMAAAVMERVDSMNDEVPLTIVRGDKIGGRQGWDGWFISLHGESSGKGTC
ncbi:hypothetical protein EW146_g116 [Bondarzewia mesenterica]|uniref:Uncharacterized protein n=1 Tax=Bondarzewia mesenterica TaxID=1095465 RepID=A0A4V3XGI5_9AGAM|nr:hypothetical protein EW146_g116 [Bondarzewia mesenterica]